MKKQNVIFYSLLACALIVLNSCFEDAGTKLLLNSTSNSQVEINEAGTAAGLDISKSYQRLNDGAIRKDSLRVNLIGPQRATATNVTFIVDPTTTAIAGFHYNLLSTGGSIAIPANSSFGYIYFNVVPDKINTGELFKIKFVLTGGDNVKASPNLGTFTRSIRILCPYAGPATFTGNYSTNEPGYGDYPNTSVLGPVANSIQINNFWDAKAIVADNPTVYYVFGTDAVNPTVNIPAQTVIMNGGVSYTVSGVGGSYDVCTKKFVANYKVVRNSNGSTADINTHTFTHL